MERNNNIIRIRTSIRIFLKNILPNNIFGKIIDLWKKITGKMEDKKRNLVLGKSTFEYPS